MSKPYIELTFTTDHAELLFDPHLMTVSPIGLQHTIIYAEIYKAVHILSSKMSFFLQKYEHKFSCRFLFLHPAADLYKVHYI